jgi:hypothetical protein
MPIRLSDAELDIVMGPVQGRSTSADNDAFLQAVASRLAGQGELGPGLVHRVVAEVQREHFDPPDLGHPSRRA